MAVALNSYASKAYSEHPIAMWPMDDDSYFLSLIKPTDRLFSNWSFTTASANPTYNVYNNNPTYLPDIIAPFPDSDYSTIFMGTSSASYLLTATSSDLFSISDLDINKGTFCINFFLYQNPTNIQWFKVGYKYIDNVSVEHVIISDEIPAPVSKSWINFNYSYDIPSNVNSPIKIFFQVKFDGNADINSRKITMNGLSIGQWSETASYKNLGVFDEELPQEVDIYDITGISADQYGILSENGYYIVENNSILAQNQGPPIIFGTDNCTKIYSSLRKNPSFIFPGKGMLNESGRYNNYSLEMWIQIEPLTNISRRIIGPLGNDYGIYVREGFISLLIGNNVLSHSIGEWYRPMLINLNLKNNVASLLINGETVISIDYDKTTLDLPNGNDWWGIYSYSDIENFNIDCISVYPYPVSEIVAKRRFVWGQGTPSVQFIDDQFGGVSTTIDFSTSEYTSNIIYPDIAQWNAGYFENMVATNNSISIPDYSLPTIYLEGRDINEWYEANKYANLIAYPGIENHPKFISFRPSTKSNNIDSYIYGSDYWSQESFLNFSSTHAITDIFSSQFGVLPSYEQDSVDENSNNWDGQYYINFPSLNVLTEPVVGVYGVFEIEANIPSTRPLMLFINTTTNNKFSIEVNGLTVIYKFNDQEIYTENISSESHFSAGINFQALGQVYGYEISNFFASLSSIQLFIGGNKVDTFEGKIYRIGFLNSLSYSLIKSSFTFDGFAKSNDDNLLLSYTTSYILMPIENYNRFSLDISVYSTWEEYYPLSKFAGYVKSASGGLYYDVDFLQINIAYPTIDLEISWKYQQLQDLQITYNSLKNDENYLSYNDLKNNNTSGQTIDTSNSSLQMYITFQNVNQNTIKPLSDFPYIKKLSSNLIIEPENENTIAQPLKAYETRFEFKDGVIIYPPKTIDFNNVAIVFHFVAQQKGIISSPLKINNFEITSRALNDNENNPIGTKFGNKILPYVKTYTSASSSTIDYKEKNPMSIYKRSTPYLYTTDNSGIKIFNFATEDKEYVASVPMNTASSFGYEIGVIQLWVMYDEDLFSSSALSLYEIHALDRTLKVYAETINDGKRAMLKIEDELNPSSTVSDVVFYQNGSFVKNPVISTGEWNCIGMLFNQGLSFDGYCGSIDLFGGALFNNISYYESDGLVSITNISSRTWDNVYKNPSPPPNYFAWSYWSGKTWKDVYILSLVNNYAIDPSIIYNTYIGNNRSIVDDSYGFNIGSSAFTAYSSIIWSQTIEKPS